MRISQIPGKKYPSAVAKGLIICFSFLLVVFLIPIIIDSSINQSIIKTEYFVKLIKRTNLSEQIPLLLSDTVIASGSSTLQSSLLTGLDQEHFDWLMTSLLPPGWIEGQSNAAISSIMDFMDLASDKLIITVEIQPIKDFLVSEKGKQSLVTLLENMPACTDDQLTQIMIAMQSGNGGLAFCHPPSSDLFNMDNLLNPVINSFLNNLPATITIPSEGQESALLKIANSQSIQIYRNTRTLLNVFISLSLLLTLGIFLLSLRSMKWVANALGFPLVIASAAAAIPGVWLYLTGGKELQGITNAGMGTFQGIDRVLIEVFQKGMQTAGQGLLVWFLGGLTLGLVLLVIGFIAKK